LNKLIVNNRESLENLVKQLHAAMDEHAQLVTFCALNARSKPQNDTFHGWTGEIARFFKANGKTEFLNGAPMTGENVKRNLKETFLGYEEVESINLKTGEVTKTNELRHTSKLSKGDMVHFMQLVETWARSFDIPLTIPEDSMYHKLIPIFFKYLITMLIYITVCIN